MKMNRHRVVGIFPILILLLALCFTGCKPTSEKAEFWGSYTSEKTYSYDHQYYAVQTVENAAVTVTIYSTATNEEIDEFSPARARDFWGICWEKDTYNLWTQSADTGNACYEYQNGKWIRNDDAVEPSYIISRYDKEYAENEEAQKGMYKSPIE